MVPDNFAIRSAIRFNFLVGLALAISVTAWGPLARASNITPKPEPEGQVVDFYAHGSMVDSSSLPPAGKGFVHLFETRDRYYGSQGLLALISRSAAKIAARFPQGERLQIGDVAARDGGPISGHDSHQNGLDIDIVYYRVNHYEQSAADGDAGFVETFVKDGAVSPNLDLRRSWEMIKLIAASGRLNRIFMHTAIKKAFCSYARAHGEYDSHAEILRRLRILDTHHDHMHVRLSCPDTSPACQSQDDPPAGTGCV